jgi:hypothetical protein
VTGELDPLHQLMEAEAEATDVLVGIDRRIRSIGHRLIAVIVVFTVVGGVALKLAVDAASKASKAADAAQVATGQLTIISATNKDLIDRLGTVAKQAQANGARADAIQCKEIERLKVPIRLVLTRAGADKETINLFKRKKCSRLPNAVVVNP